MDGLEAGQNINSSLGYSGMTTSLFCVIGTWSVDALSTKLTCTPSTIRRHLGYWVGQGVLREDLDDMFTTIERQTEAIRSCPTTGRSIFLN